MRAYLKRPEVPKVYADLGLTRFVQLRPRNRALAARSLLVITELHARMADVTNYRDGQPVLLLSLSFFPLPSLLTAASRISDDDDDDDHRRFSYALLRPSKSREYCYQDYPRTRQIKRNDALVTASPASAPVSSLVARERERIILDFGCKGGQYIRQIDAVPQILLLALQLFVEERGIEIIAITMQRI